MSKTGSKALILQFLLANIGRVIESKELQSASGGASEWARRVRELRDEEGYQILSHNDRSDLKPGQYLLLTGKRRPAFARDISKERGSWREMVIPVRCAEQALGMMISFIQAAKYG